MFYRSGWCFLLDGNLLQPIRSTTQIEVEAPHQYGTSTLVFQTSFRGKTVVASRNVVCFLTIPTGNINIFIIN